MSLSTLDTWVTMTFTLGRTILFPNHSCPSPLPHRNVSGELGRKLLPQLVLPRERMAFLIGATGVRGPAGTARLFIAPLSSASHMFSWLLP